MRASHVETPGSTQVMHFQNELNMVFKTAKDPSVLGTRAHMEVPRGRNYHARKQTRARTSRLAAPGPAALVTPCDA